MALHSAGVRSLTTLLMRRLRLRAARALRLLVAATASAWGAKVRELR
jgi:hypothetical protein